MNCRKLILTTAIATALAVPAAAIAAPEFKPRGRFHLDYGYNDSDATELANGFLNRRARMGVSGKLDETWKFQIEYDFAEGGTSAKDVRLTRNVNNGTLKIGQFKVPFGLNELTSSNSFTFMERASSSNIIADSRRLGIGYDRFSGDVGFQGMVYGRAIGDGLGGGDMPLGLGARVVFNPVKSDDRMIHLGAAFAHESRNDAGTLRFRDRPEARASSGTRLIDTGAIDAVGSTLKLGGEIAWQSGPLSAEAEYMQVKVNRDAGPEPTFNGYHVLASYVLTGESRGYSGGKFGGVSPAKPGGAWEVAARYSHADLDDAGFAGGVQQNITLGVNYYATSKVRFMGNVIFADIEGGVAGVDESPTMVTLRAQYSF